jgi:conjugal transfer/type IV secretion protein DotA/TraY
MSRYIILILFLLGSVANAQLSFEVPTSDLSFIYLAKIFGNIEGVIQTSGVSQILGRMLNILNTGCLGVAGIILAYIFYVSTINTANSGEIMGKGWSTVWLPLRATVGLSLLIPKTSGYCTMQAIIMWVVMQGIGMANVVWHTALDYAVENGGIFGSDNTAKKPGLELSSQKNSIVGLAQSYYQSASCVVAINKALEQKNADEIRQAQDAIDNFTPGFGVSLQELQENLDELLLNAGGAFNTGFDFEDNNISKNNIEYEIPFPGKNNQYAGACGGIKIPVTDNGQANTNLAQAKVGAHERLYNKMLAIAEDFVDNTVEFNLENNLSSIDLIESDTSSSNRFAQAVVDHFFDMELAGTFLGSTETKNTLNGQSLGGSSGLFLGDNFIQVAKKEGWITAGGTFFELVQLVGKQTDKDQAYKQVEFILKNSFKVNSDFADAPEISTSDKNFINKLFGIEQEVPTNIYINGYNKIIDSKIDDINNSGTQISGEDQYQVRVEELATINIILTSYTAALILFIAILFAGISPLTGLVALATSSAGLIKTMVGFNYLLTDHWPPILSISLMGSGMVDAAIGSWGAGAATIFYTVLATGAMPGFNPIPFAVIAGIGFVAPVITLLLGMLMSGGAVLAIYTPLIPAIVFTFGAIGWFIAVIEAIVAGPLVALGLMHPDGHEVLGKAEQAVLLLLNIFLRPCLMIIGFIAATLLSKVVIWLLNKALVKALLAVISSPTIIGLGAVVMVPAIIFIYGSVCISAFQACFELISKLPDEILKWIGGPVTSYASSASQGVSQGLQSSIGGAYSKLNSAMSESSVGAAKKNANDALENKAQQRSSKEQSDFSATGENSSGSSGSSGSSDSSGSSGGGSAGGQKGNLSRSSGSRNLMVGNSAPPSKDKE